MSPKKHISMRLDPEFKDALDATLEAEEKVHGRTGGVSLLFRRLGALYLREPLPAQNWRSKNPEPQDEDLSLRSMDDIEAELVEMERQVWTDWEPLDSKQKNRAKRLLQTAESLTHPLMTDEPSMNSHRGIVLIGRLRLLVFSAES